MKYKCPCCDQYTLEHPSGSYDICPICFWEDDKMQLENPNYSSGANRISLVEARKNYTLGITIKQKKKPL